jgi:UDP-glucose 4-epimerase
MPVMKILVTGGAGFIASHIVDAYLAAGHTIAILDDFSTGKESNLNPRAEVYKGSITDVSFVEKVFADFQPEIVNHHAAQISVITSIREPRDDAERNILGTITILDAMRKSGSAKKIIYPSSGGTIYGQANTLPCTEEAPIQPIAPYPLSKFVGEQYIRLYEQLYGIEGVVMRYGNVFGPRQDPHGEAGVCAIFTPRMLQGEPVSIFGDGTQMRDYIYITDVVAANLIALEKGAGEMFNIGTGIGTTTLDVFRTIKDVTKYPHEAVMAPARSGELQACYLSPAKAKQQLDWQPQVDFAEGIAKTVAWYREGGM